MARPVPIDGEKLLRHYADCYQQAHDLASSSTDPLVRARAEGAADAFEGLFQGLRRSIEKSGVKVEIRPKNLDS